jgi:transposase
MLYVLRIGCSWHHLPHDFLLGKVLHSIQKMARRIFFRFLNDQLRRLCRIKDGRMPEPAAGVVDSQSTKTTERRTIEVMTVERKLKDKNVIYW